MTETLAIVALAKTLTSDKSIDNVVDDIAPRLGRNGDIYNLKLERLSYITVKSGENIELRIFGPQMFILPPTKPNYLVKKLLDTFLSDIQVHNHRDIEITAKPGVSFKNVSTGFETVWEIKVGNTVIGKIREIGNFYDRNTNIEIDFSNLKN